MKKRKRKKENKSKKKRRLQYNSIHWWSWQCVYRHWCFLKSMYVYVL